MKNEEEIEFCMLPCFLTPGNFVDAVGEKIKDHQRKTDYCYFICSLWFINLLATLFTSVLSFLSEYYKTACHHQFPQAKLKTFQW